MFYVINDSSKINYANSKMHLVFNVAWQQVIRCCIYLYKIEIIITNKIKVDIIKLQH